jgi:tetratricopeptide (TPR) repeat protein
MFSTSFTPARPGTCNRLQSHPKLCVAKVIARPVYKGMACLSPHCMKLRSCRALALAWLIAIAGILPLCSQTTTSVYEQAASLLQHGEADAAIHLLEGTLGHSPQDLKARTLLGMALSATGRLDEAGRQFSQVLQINPRFAPALKNLAVNEMALGQVPKAKGHFEQLLEMAPADPVAHLALAEIEFGAKQYAAAVSHYEKSGDLYRKDPRNIIEFAQACLQTNQAAKAVELLTHVPKEAGAGTHFTAGTLLATLADYTGAARELELAKDGYPDTYALGYNLTLAYVKGKNYSAASRTAEDLVSRGYRKAELYNLMAQAYENSGKTREAYGALRTATQIDPADESNYIDLVTLCLNHKNYALALEIAEIGIGRLPSSDRLQIQRGVVFAMKEQFADARAAFEKALQLAPAKSLPYVALALVLMQRDEVAEATRILRKRVRMDANDYLALWFLGEALNRGGAAPGSAEQKEAMAALERSVKLNPDVVQSRILLSKLLFRNGDLEHAASNLEHAIQLEPDNTAALYQLAQVCSKKGQSERAKQLFAKVSKAKAEDREQFTSGGLQQILREGAR